MAVGTTLNGCAPTFSLLCLWPSHFLISVGNRGTGFVWVMPSLGCRCRLRPHQLRMSKPRNCDWQLITFLCHHCSCTHDLWRHRRVTKSPSFCKIATIRNGDFSDLTVSCQWPVAATALSTVLLLIGWMRALTAFSASSQFASERSNESSWCGRRPLQWRLLADSQRSRVRQLWFWWIGVHSS